VKIAIADRERTDESTAQCPGRGGIFEKANRPAPEIYAERHGPMIGSSGPERVRDSSVNIVGTV
jgi:hypothetical protein